MLARCAALLGAGSAAERDAAEAAPERVSATRTAASTVFSTTTSCALRLARLRVIETTTITPEVDTCGTTGIKGLVGTNDVGSVCCPTGCRQCGGAGCGSSGAGEGLGNTDCCINGVLNNHDVCSALGQAPCVIDGEPATGADTCDSLGIVAIEGSNDNGSVCCPEECLQCGGAGCASSGAASGLDNTDCCINGVLANRGSCADSGEAPCVL